MDYETYSDNYFSLLHELQELLKKEVDLVAEKTLKNPYLIESIEQNTAAMISLKEKKLLADLLESIVSIDEHLEGRRNFDEYEHSKTKRQAVERQLEIIGEAMSKL
ncbi:HepT-like ribonuclease domain-containing protein, partial [uncultured Flavobacterium sp.]|uniref:HepT-like ribonuclease domain-containing protein n=1 Tax=uncultured Flavobacterium sp. TaxID=165435 RepID=UPI003452FDFA